jgi:hypothetical protein
MKLGQQLVGMGLLCFFKPAESVPEPQDLGLLRASRHVYRWTKNKFGTHKENHDQYWVLSTIRLNGV